MRPSVPFTKDLVLVGGGHAHVAVLKSFAMRPVEGVRLTLVTRETHAPYSGMLPGSVAGHYTKDECHVDLAPLARLAKVQMIHAEVEGIRREDKQVVLRGRPPLRYDLLSINVGIRPKMEAAKGSDRHAVPVKPIDGFWTRWQTMVNEYKNSEQTTTVVVVGGGAGGVELVLAMQHRLHQEREASSRPLPPANFVLCTQGSIIQSHPQARNVFVEEFKRRGVKLFENRKVVSVQPDHLQTEDGLEIPFTHCLWCTEAGAPKWLKENTGLETDEAGFLVIRPTLQTLTDDNIFAVGDCASCKEYPRPKAGVFAVRQGPPLAENLKRVLSGELPRPFKPQSNYLSIVSTGNKYGMALYGKWFILRGEWVWRWKNWLDISWMNKYGKDLPFEMMESDNDKAISKNASTLEFKEAMKVSGMRCAGCGAKIGSSVLKRVLQRLEPTIVHRPEVLMGVKSAEDAAVVEYPPGKVSVSTVDFFRAFMGDMYTFGRISALHALSDLFAMGAEPVSAMALATIPYASEQLSEDMLFQLLSGACEEFRKANCSLVGGHTCEGEETSLGFSVSGMGEKGQLLCKAGAVPGDAIILTKPIGTGLIFAADMRGKAKARWLDESIHYMTQSNAQAADILRKYQASSCTDVTGFGLVGHLLEILDASNVTAELHADSVPMLEGSTHCAEAGIFSSLYPSNLQLCRSVDNLSEARLNPAWPIFFDPQTSGGLLASVAPENALSTLEELHKAGYEKASVIGHVKERSDRLEKLIVA
eukprot:scaffold764_cov363-Pavlova_lutheri.AAC.11